jgi:hypothetical protein
MKTCEEGYELRRFWGGDEETWAREGGEKTWFGEGNEDMARKSTC